MADTKISALPASTTPLAGTEVLPIVQSGATKQVSVANLTAGRAVSATQMTLTTGNLIVASGQGVDFSATAGAPGATSELLNDYEEGTWTPAITSALGTVTLVDGSACTYTKVGRFVYLFARVGITTDALVGTSNLTITGLPFTVYQVSLGNFTYTNFSSTDYGVGGAQGLVYVDGTSLSHVARTIDISSRSSTFYWMYAAVYSV